VIQAIYDVLVRLLKKEINRVTIDVIVPPENISDFSFGEITGNNSLMKKLWQPQKPIMHGFKRSGIPYLDNERE